MQRDRGASTNGRAPSAEKQSSLLSELNRLRTTCRRQERTITALGQAMAVMRSGADVLNAENADLRAANQRMRDLGAGTPATPAAVDDEATEIRLELDAKAPAAARAFVTGLLQGRVPDPVLDRARLLTSELVTNSVIHSHAPEEARMVFRLEFAHGAVRLEVEDPGRRGAVAPRPPDFNGAGGFGLNLVQRLSERWGVERVAAGGTRVWAQIALQSSGECRDLAEVRALSLPAADGGRVRPSIGAPELFPLPDVAPLAGRAVPGAELDEEASAALVNAIAAFSDDRSRSHGGPADA